MPGWVPFDADGWPEVAATLAQCRPWPEAAAAFHLRWLKDRYPDRPLPGRPSLRVLFGWTDWKVRALLRSEVWRDPIQRRQPTASAPPADRQRAASGPPAPERANLDNGQQTASGPPADRQRAASAPPADLHTRVDPPSPSPSPAPSKKTSANASWSVLFEEVKLSDGEPTDPRRWRVWAFKLSEDAWHTYRQTHHRIKPRALKWSGKASSDGGSLWRMMDSRASFEQFKAVLLWLDSSEHQRATFYRDSQQTLVTIRRHLEELHGLAIDEANQLTEQQQRDQRYSRADEQDPEALRASAEKLRRWVAEQQEQRT